MCYSSTSFDQYMYHIITTIMTLGISFNTKLSIVPLSISSTSDLSYLWSAFHFKLVCSFLGLHIMVPRGIYFCIWPFICHNIFGIHYNLNYITGLLYFCYQVAFHSTYLPQIFIYLPINVHPHPLSFGLLWMELIETFLYRSLCARMNLFFLKRPQFKRR